MTTPSAPPIVLLVDDDEDCRIIFPLALRHAGFEVEVAATADQGLALAKRVRPDVVLLDRVMPIRHGDELLADLKALPTTRDVPIVAITANTSKSEIDPLKELGYTDVLLKPIDPGALVAQVERILDRH